MPRTVGARGASGSARRPPGPAASVPSEQTHVPASLRGHSSCRRASMLKRPEQLALRNHLEGGGSSHTVGHGGRLPSCPRGHAVGRRVSVRLGRRLSSCSPLRPSASVMLCEPLGWGRVPVPPAAGSVSVCWLRFTRTRRRGPAGLGRGKQRRVKGRSFLLAPSDQDGPEGQRGGPAPLVSACAPSRQQGPPPVCLCLGLSPDERGRGRSSSDRERTSHLSGLRAAGEPAQRCEPAASQGGGPRARPGGGSGGGWGPSLAEASLGLACGHITQSDRASWNSLLVLG